KENALRETKCETGAHLVDDLERRPARLRHLTGMAHRGDVAEAQTRIIVAGPDDPVEVYFLEHVTWARRGSGRQCSRRAARPPHHRCKCPSSACASHCRSRPGIPYA